MKILQALRQAYARFMTPAPFTTRVLRCDPSSISFVSSSDDPVISCSDTKNALDTAAHDLRDLLQTVVFPTETVYGLGAAALNTSATAKIFATKGRPADNPLIVHVSSFAMLRTLLPPNYALPKSYEALMKHFWPGALTLLFPRNTDVIPTIITANQPTVAIRMPSHPVARALIAIANVPVAAPSANTSGKPSPTRVEHALQDLAGKVHFMLDGGACGVGLESTVVDGLHTDGDLRVLRPGGVTVEDIERVVRLEMPEGSVPKVLVHRRDFEDEGIERAPTTPGMKYRHYSPAVPVTLLCTTSKPPNGEPARPVEDFLASLKKDNTGSLKVGVMASDDSALWGHVGPMDGVTWERFFLGNKAEPSVTAHRLFDALLTLERNGVDMILVEEIEETREGLAVMNRVRKAAGDFQWVTLA